MTDQIPQFVQTDVSLLPPRVASATFSPCGLYRFRLDRVWDPSVPPVCFVMLNPSTADAFRADATARRVINYAKRWGHGGVRIVNAFAMRATDPRDMIRAACPVDPIGRAGDNDRFILSATRGIRTIVAWGAHGSHAGRDREVLALLEPNGPVYCLATTRDGRPCHPLRLAADLEPEPYALPEVAR